VFASSAGDTLKVRGTCSANLSIEHDLNLVGPATLDGGGSIVVWVNAGNLSLRDVKITNGSSTFMGGGIYNYGTVTLNGSTSVIGNISEDGGGGIYNEGTIVMNGRSSVTGNSLLFGPGGGIWNVGTVVMNRLSSITANSAIDGGGVYNQGTLVLNGAASITGNSAWSGGGIFNDGGEVEFSEDWRGTVCGNTPDDWPSCTPLDS
jgi:predicted outer membrane repeat protein